MTGPGRHGRHGKLGGLAGGGGGGNVLGSAFRRPLTFLKWLLPFALLQLSLTLLLSNQKDGVHCPVFLRSSVSGSSSSSGGGSTGLTSESNAAATLKEFVAWAVEHGLVLSPNVSIAMVTDSSYSGLNADDGQETSDNASSSSGGGGGGSSGMDSSRTNAVQRGPGGVSGSAAVFVEHGWGWEAARRRRRVVRGVAAVQDMSAGDLVCKIPLTLALWDNETYSDEPSASASHRRTRELAKARRGWDTLALRLLQERRRGLSSPWAAYIRSLPHAIPLPMFLPPEDLDEIQWPSARQEATRMQRETAESYAWLKQTHPWLTLSDFRWAVAAVHSRAFTLPVNRTLASAVGKDDEATYERYVMMPFMDVINHHYNNHMDWMAKPITADGVIEIRLKRGAKRSDELFTCFGPRSNDNLFLYYGFMLPNNPFDSLPIFDDFQAAVVWLLQTIQQDCQQQSKGATSAGVDGSRQRSDTAAAAEAAGDASKHTARGSSGEWRILGEQRGGPCLVLPWEAAWKAAKAAVDSGKVPDLLEDEQMAWWELVGMWGDLGFEFLPYRAGPVVRPGGLVDPALLAAFHAVTLLHNRTDVSSAFPACRQVRAFRRGFGEEAGVGGNDRDGGASHDRWLSQRWCCRRDDGRVVCGGRGSSSLEQMNSHSRRNSSSTSKGTEEGSSGGHTVMDVSTMVPASSSEVAAEYARVVVARRCFDLLISLPTSISYDRGILAEVNRESADGSGDGCSRGSRQITQPWVLAVRYRLMMKELLLKVMRRHSYKHN